jgi:FlaA1/EpsC-like NDP-sugar epimerase
MTALRRYRTVAIDRAIRFALQHRRVTSAAIHIVLIVISSYLAFALRFDWAVPPQAVWVWKLSVPVLIVIRSAVFIPLRLYEGLWRYTSVWDLQRIGIGVFLSSVLFWFVVSAVPALGPYPRSVYMIDAFLLVMFMGGVRMTRRVIREARHGYASKRVLVLGAGDAGEMIVRDMHRNPSYGSSPIGFLDDDPAKKGKRIHGVPVLGSRQDIDEILKKHPADEILIAIPSETPPSLRNIARSLRPHAVTITTLPSMRDLVQCQVTVNQIRPLVIEDLLTRVPVGLDITPVRKLIEGKRVLITGAGGSIGSELCRQVAALKPARLAMIERYENSLHFISVEVGDRWPETPSWPYLADITDRKRIEHVFADVRPEIVFHAAAHKHVPMVEMNPSEGFKNNVLGTRTLAEVAQNWGVERFLFISTDKAVNPTNVMGATKRVAEFCIQTLGNSGPTAFCAVRFGNVLGSNGSVVPRFLEQIEAGGPVTVTHPDIRRFFMLIPEAVQLVLHAAAQAQPGAVYVLEMGDQINVADMARNLIRLTGHVPDDEIKIEFTGLRPGEKLYEELIGTDESSEPSGIEGIHRVVRKRPFDRERIKRHVDIAIQAAIEGCDAEVISRLQEIVPTYRPYVSTASAGDRAAAAGGRVFRPGDAALDPGAGTDHVALAASAGDRTASAGDRTPAAGGRVFRPGVDSPPTRDFHPGDPAPIPS